MSTDNTALPAGGEVPSEASGQPNAEQLDQSTEKPSDDAPEGEKKPEAKPEKTPEQREIERLRRGIDRRTRQLAEARARLDTEGLRSQAIERDNRSTQDDSDTLTLSRAELQQRIKDEAQRLAPTLREQQAEIEHRQKVVTELAKEFGQEKFDALASDLDEAFDGLADRSGKPKPATDAIFESDDPKGLIEYLADPDNAAEAEAISRMNPVQAGRAVAKLETKLAALKAEGKPQPSKAAAPLAPLRGHGTSTPNPEAMSDAEFAAWRKKQIASRR